MLLCSLKSSYITGLEFDSRPGLKFLVQKVTQLNNVANLYKQVGASWSIIALTLFDLCMKRLQTCNVTADDIKKDLRMQQKTRNTSQFSSVQDDEVTKDQEDGGRSLTENNRFFVDLHNLFLELCELYVDILVDKDNTRSKLDDMARQQVYFLTIEPDDFHEFVMRPENLKRTSQRESSMTSMPSTHGSENGSEKRSERLSTDDQDLTEKQTSPSPKQKDKPFQFADFVHQPVRPESPIVSDGSEVAPGSSVHESVRERLNSGITDQDVDENTAEVADEVDEEVFRVATQAEMDSMLCQYRFQKGKRTMPSSTSTPPSSASVQASRQNPFLNRPTNQAKTNENTDPEIADQQRASLMADSEAQITVWTELVLVLFHLSSSLEDGQFKTFLPVFFPAVKSLTAHARNDELKQQIADFFQRVASIYDFNAEG